MSTSSSPSSSPSKSGRNAEGADAQAFYDPAHGNAQFNENSFFGHAAGIIEDDEEDARVAAAADKFSGALIDGGALGLHEAFRAQVEHAVRFARSADGKDWHCTSVNSAERKEGGGCSLGLVLCSGDLCTMKKYDVAADGAVTAPASGGGLFGGF
jgi:hypothetical protein